MAQLAQRFSLNLTNTFARHVKLFAYFFKRMVSVHPNPETHPQHTLFTRRQGCQNACRGLAQIRVDRTIDRRKRVFIFDEVTELIAEGALAILDAFQRSTVDLLGVMSEDLHQSALSEASRSAHAVKGSAANVGAQALALIQRMRHRHDAFRRR